ncbi:7-deoxyloganetic acid glucosyltransferase-like [Phalaenopsis equestris]|uniref:7-deoxyloganetic acid glucosyltransferase-like n=1 Tax=Phalaenopsis equestris TaxID=78828 RepID=UPI0009E4ACFD|nr:7-deoxyloganetic acid glucosyltransferase-like [Phalaenopsis equestris]
MAAHAVIFTFPSQGNASPMLKLAELLSLANIHITFINTENIHRRFLLHSPDLDRLARLPCFRFRTIPDGLPEDHPRPMLDFLNLMQSLSSFSRQPYKEILTPASGIDPDGWPRVTCVIADGTLSLAYEVPAELGLPVIFFRTSSACSFWAYHCIPLLLKNGELPFPGYRRVDRRLGRQMFDING